MRNKITVIVLSFFFVSLLKAQTTVGSLAELRTALVNSNQNIVMTSGTYYLEDLPSDSRVINCTGSDNTIDLTGVLIRTRVGSIREVYFIISGDNNVLRNGAIEDFYQSGLEEVTDFSAYNNDRDNLAYGLRGAPIMSITGSNNLVEGLEMTVKGSFPYGYGSQYGIGSTNTFGLNKRCGILITGSDGGGVANTLDSITMHHYAFGHGIYMQSGATETTIKNCYIEGRMRLSDDMYNDTETYDLPYITDYKFPSGEDWRTLPFLESYDIPRGDNSVVYPLSEDGIRSYNSTGSVVVENCTVKQMRGGIRLYLASSATVTNSTAIDCGAGGTNYNMPNGGTIIGSSGNFAYTSLNDNRLSRSNQNIEMTIIPSPHAVGPHNIADILGNNEDIVFHRTPGPLDSDEERSIVVSGDNSTIVNETEYAIILESGASGNEITSCGPVIDNGSGNTINLISDCDFDLGDGACHITLAQIEAECLDDISGAQVEEPDANGVIDIGSIKNGYWARYNALDLSQMNSVSLTASSDGSGGDVELRLDSVNGRLISVVNVPNTGGWGNWDSFGANIERVSGEHDLYLVFSGSAGWLYNIDYFGFSEEVICNNADSHIEAECFTGMDGIQTENCSEGTKNIGWINNGDWAKYSGLDLSGKKSIKVRTSGNTTGSVIEVRLGSETGSLIGELEVSNTGGNQNWLTDSVNIIETDGVQDVYLVFTGGEGYLFNVNHFEFSEESTVVTNLKNQIESSISIFPNPTTGVVQFSSTTNYEVINSFGEVILSGEGSLIDLSSFSKGIYVVQYSGGLQKIIKQ